MSWRPRDLMLAGFALANAVAQSRNPPRGDDLVYLAWSMERVSPLRALEPFDLFPGWRPMNALAWWLGARLTGVDGSGAAALLALVWGVAWLAWTAWARRRWGPDAAFWAGALLLLTAPFRDLLLWRSWMTSTGAAACMGLCLLALERGRRPWALVAAAAAVGFKETAVLPIAAASILLYGDRVTPLLAFACAAPSWVRIALSDPWPGPRGTAENLGRYVVDLAKLGWPVVAAGAAVLTHQVPAWRTVVIVCSVAVLPLLYPYYNITYLLDGLVFATCFVGAWIASQAPKLQRRVAVPLLLATLPALGQTALDVRYQWAQRAQLDALWAEVVDFPPVAWRLDSDANDSAKLLAMWIYFRLNLAPDESRAAEMVPLDGRARGLMVVLDPPS